MATLDRTRLASLLEAEQAAYTQTHPRSRALFGEADNLFGRVPMTWMNMWTGGFPLYLDHARGNRITDVDGLERQRSRRHSQAHGVATTGDLVDNSRGAA